MNKKDNKKMLSIILKFYKFKIYQGIAFIYLETYKNEKSVIMNTNNGIFNYFISKDDLLEAITTRTKSFIYGECNPKRVPNIFLGCKSLDEVCVKIDLNTEIMKV